MNYRFSDLPYAGDHEDMAHLEVSTIIPASRSQVFEFLSDPEFLKDILKDHVDVEVVRGAEAVRRGAEYELIMTRFGLAQPVRLKVEDVLKGNRLTYRQVEGLFANWVHTIKFEDHGENQTLVTDYVDYTVPFGLFGHLIDDLFVRRDMTQILEARLKRVCEHFNTADVSVKEESL